MALLCLLPMFFQAAHGATTNVSFGSYFFNPKVVQIKVGDTVNWIGTGLHNLVGTGADPICGGNELPCSYKFDSPGSFPYICEYHSDFKMTGLVIVASSPAPPSPAVLTNALRLPNGQIRFTVMTTANQTNIVQASTNPASFTAWLPLTTNLPASNSFIFTDSNAPAFSRRFYRVAEPH